MFCQMVILTL